MKKSFVRGIWGIYNNSGDIMLARRKKIDLDIKFATLNPYEPKIKVYVFGEDNYKYITDLGYDAKLIHKKPIVWDMLGEQYRHKIEIWHQALQDFDEITFLDWDCIPARQIPKDYWEVMEEGPHIRSTIYMYHKKRCFWKKEDQRKVMAATFLYLRGKNVGENIIGVWERNQRLWSEEITLMRYIEEVEGGKWIGLENYRDKYEPLYHTLYNYGEDFTKTREMTFFHCNRNTISRLMGREKNPSKEDIRKRLDEFCKRRIELNKIRNG